MPDTILIPHPDSQAADSAKERLMAAASFAPQSLDKLERLAVKLSAATGRVDWLPVRRGILIFAGDHGFMPAESAADSRADVRRVLDGGRAVNVVARQNGAFLVVVDVGLAERLPMRPTALAGADRLRERLQKPELLVKKLAKGTTDFRQGEAMTPEQVDAALDVGIAAVEAHAALGLDLLGVAAMGRGHDLAARTLITALTGVPPLDETIESVHKALTINQPIEQDSLRKFGGLELVAMIGAIMAAASRRIPVVLDDVAGMAAGLVAVSMVPHVRHFLIVAGTSDYPECGAGNTVLGLEPVLDFNLAGGEGLGAALAFPVIESAMRMMQERIF